MTFAVMVYCLDIGCRGSYISIQEEYRRKGK
jgi:hypothetical protein